MDSEVPINISNSRLGILGRDINIGSFHLDQSQKIAKERDPPIYHKFDLASIPSVLADRRKKISEIETALGKPTGIGARICVLVGLGGAGKSTLAKIYTKQEREKLNFYNLIWIDAEYEKNISRSFKLLLDPQTKAENLLVLIEDYGIEQVYTLLLKHKTLLVFDNVEDVAVLKRFLPQVVPLDSFPFIIITTRLNKGWKDLGDHVVHIRELSSDVCEAYIREFLSKSPLTIPDIDLKWRPLARRFGGLVIALRSAASSILEQNKIHHNVGLEVYTISQFLEEVSKVGILEPADDPDDPAEITYGPLRRLWTKTLDNLPRLRHGKTAEMMLSFLAFTSPDDGIRSQWMFDLCGDLQKREVTMAINLLFDWSLVQKSGENLLMHRVLQATIRSRVTSNRATLRKFFEWLSEAFQRIFQSFSIIQQDQVGHLDEYAHDFMSTLMNVLKSKFPIIPDEFLQIAIETNKIYPFWFRKFLNVVFRKVKYEAITFSSKTLHQLLQTEPCYRYVTIPFWIKISDDEKIPLAELLGSVADLIRRQSRYLQDPLVASQNSNEIIAVLDDVSKLIVRVFSQEFEAYKNDIDKLETLAWGLWWVHYTYFHGIFGISRYDRSKICQFWSNLATSVQLLSQSPEAVTSPSGVAILSIWDAFFRTEAPVSDQVPSHVTPKELFKNIPAETRQIQDCRHLLEEFYNRYATEKPTADQIEVEAKLLCQFKATLENPPSEKPDKLMSWILYFVDRLSDIYSSPLVTASILPLIVLYLYLEANMEVLKLSATALPIEPLMLLKLKTLSPLFRQCLKKFPDFITLPLEDCPDELEKAAVKLTWLLPNISQVIKFALDQCHNLSGKLATWGVRNVCNFEATVRLLGYNNLEFLSLEIDYGLSYRFVEAMTKAAVAEYEVQSKTENFRCFCVHAKYQEQLVYLYVVAGKFQAAIKRGLEVFDHKMKCFNVAELDKILSSLSRALTSMKKEAQLNQLFEVHFNRLKESGFKAWHNEVHKSFKMRIRLYCYEGRFAEAASLAQELFDESDAIRRKDPNWCTAMSYYYVNFADRVVTVLFGLLVRRDFKSIIKFCAKIVESFRFKSENREVMNLMLGYKYIFSVFGAISLYARGDFEAAATLMRLVQVPKGREMQDEEIAIVVVVVNWCARIQERFSNVTSGNDFTDFYAQLRKKPVSGIEQMAVYLGIMDTFVPLMSSKKSTCELNTCMKQLESCFKGNVDCLDIGLYEISVTSEWQFRFQCLIREYRRGVFGSSDSMG